jgi:hypothetical protein
LAIATKGGVEPYGPYLPNPPIFEKNEYFRNFLLTKCTLKTKYDEIVLEIIDRLLQYCNRVSHTISFILLALTLYSGEWRACSFARRRVQSHVDQNTRRYNEANGQYADFGQESCTPTNKGSWEQTEKSVFLRNHQLQSPHRK